MTFADELKETARKQREEKNTEAQVWMDRHWKNIASELHNVASQGCVIY
jgi:hypothetical protein